MIQVSCEDYQTYIYWRALRTSLFPEQMAGFRLKFGIGILAENYHTTWHWDMFFPSAYLGSPVSKSSMVISCTTEAI